MTAVAKWIFVVSLAGWLGSVGFFSFVVAPSVFRAFPEEQRAEAGRVVGTIFPSYYRTGYVCGVVLLISTVLLWRGAATAPGRWAAAAVIVALMLAATFYAGLVIQPRAHSLRQEMHRASAAAKPEFDRLHRRAVQLNAAVLVGGLVLSGIAAASLRP
jgi:uncharacterized membrane protein